jgi:hypothetical protein
LGHYGSQSDADRRVFSGFKQNLVPLFQRPYWHIAIQKKAERLVLRLLGAVHGPDLTDYSVAVVSGEV